LAGLKNGRERNDENLKKRRKEKIYIPLLESNFFNGNFRKNNLTNTHKFLYKLI